MNSLYNYVYSEGEFEDIQKRFDGKAEFDNGSIFYHQIHLLNIMKLNLIY